MDKELLNETIEKVLSYQTAFEQYLDNTSNCLTNIEKLFEDIKYLTQNEELTSEEKYQMARKIILEFDRIRQIAGKERFPKDENGYVKYLWDYSLM